MMKLVRALALLCLLVAAIFTASCHKESSLIVGEWKLVALSGDNVEGNNDLNTNLGATYNFTASGKVKFTLDGYPLVGSYTYSDDRITIEVLTRTYKFNIEELTSSVLKVVYPSEYGLTRGTLEKQ
ncbi:MAG: lipocalin family protein [Bacteroidales bacterium]|nr:lipocalin family protein [Bacteroidales bacterium]